MVSLNSWRNRIALILLVAVVSVWWFTRKPTPSLEAVDGTYSNPCCEPIRLQHGELVVGKERMNFRLANMKFGLTAYTPQEIAVRGDHIETTPSDDGSAIPFDEDRRGFTVLGSSQREYHFVRK